MAGVSAPRPLAFGKCQKRAIGFEQFAIDFVIIDHDAETVFNLGKQAGNRHGIKFGQMAEKAGFGSELRNPIMLQSQDIAQYPAQDGIGFNALLYAVRLGGHEIRRCNSRRPPMAAL